MSQEILSAGIAVVVLAVCVVGLRVLGTGLSWIGKAGLAMAQALENLKVILENLKLSNDKQNQVLQELASAQVSGLAEVKALSLSIETLNTKISKLPPDIQRGVTDALDSFLDRLGETLKRHNQIPPDFSREGHTASSSNSYNHNRPLPLWVRLLGM